MKTDAVTVPVRTVQLDSQHLGFTLGISGMGLSTKQMVHGRVQSSLDALEG